MALFCTRITIFKINPPPVAPLPEIFVNAPSGEEKSSDNENPPGGCKAPPSI